MKITRLIVPAVASALLVNLAFAADDVRRGETVYNGTCIACHGADGSGALPSVPDFKDKAGVLAKTDTHLLRSLLDGVERPDAPISMPPKGGDPALTEDDMKAVLAYIRQNLHPK